MSPFHYGTKRGVISFFLNIQTFTVNLRIYIFWSVIQAGIYLRTHAGTECGIRSKF